MRPQHVRAVAILALTAVVPSACSSDSPIDERIGESRIVAQVGPGGRQLRGDGGSPLEGFVLDVPPGALQRLHDVSIEVGPPIEVPGTVAASVPLRVRIEPDPGVLALPASMTLVVDLPEFRDPGDLAVASRPSADQPSAQPDPAARIGVLADHGEFDDATDRYTFAAQSLSDLQVRLTRGARQTDDATRLTMLGFEALFRFTDAGVAEADQLFAEAQRADPFLASANLFRAIGRIAVVLADRRDDGPGLDSVGEALTAIGIDVTRESLIERALTENWPRSVRVPTNAPTAAEVLALYRRRVRPALLLALGDLDRVPFDTQVLVTLPARITALPGERELDAADLLLLRGLIAGVLFTLDMLEDLDLEAPLAELTSPAGLVASLDALLARYPNVGRLRSLPAPATLAALEECLFALRAGIETLRAEDDDQRDDLVVFARSFGPARQDLWRANLASLLASVQRAEPRRITLESGLGTLLVDLGLPLSSGALEPRVFWPRLNRFLPVAGSLPDPRLGGVLPELTQARATALLGMVNEHELPTARVVADGFTADWPQAADALLPADPVADAEGDGLRAIDLRRAWLADSGDDLALRLTVADGPVQIRPDQPTYYGFVFRDLRARGLGPRGEVTVELANGVATVAVQRGGRGRVVRSEVGFDGADLELTLNRFDLLDPDEPVRDRVVEFFTQALDLRTSVEGGDRTRSVVTRF